MKNLNSVTTLPYRWEREGMEKEMGFVEGGWLRSWLRVSIKIFCVPISQTFTIHIL